MFFFYPSTFQCSDIVQARDESLVMTSLCLSVCLSPHSAVRVTPPHLQVRYFLITEVSVRSPSAITFIIRHVSIHLLSPLLHSPFLSYRCTFEMKGPVWQLLSDSRVQRVLEVFSSKIWKPVGSSTIMKTFQLIMK